MKIRQLEAFRAVMLCQTVTRAAEMLHISQPATTRLIADLEDAVGFSLFERMRGRLHPTAEAQALFEEVQRSLVGIDRIAQTALDIRDMQRGSLQIAAAPALALSFLPRAIAAFMADHPQIQITMLPHSSRTVVNMVSEQRCDVGFAILSMNHPSTHGERLLSTRMVCAIPAGHRLASQEVIRPPDLAGERFVSHPRVLDSRLQIDALFASYGIECKVQVETQVSWSICAFVEEGLGVALIDPITALEYKGNGVCFRMFDPLLTTDFSVLFSAQRAPSILLKAFVAHTRAFALARLDPRFVVG
ncbi:LysR substrate-binding domain-containing protein [Cupriavidus taiwanensis]|uniref:Transcriptional regulator, LysR family n=1 Tax=Cupriavidus taiwanensis (strain DSM 17343 / BCRC 17206 / CCUG 44338 / CIP 107171 / LMG 19424 / R1) TaxID=977880 RepID=B3RAG4_CUPTR|nr:LysR substrate-binding domain-containing protein [Cupriavidus taiwanensis]CAQ71889.1 putative transcriptional regulator, LysR family [Cupriavidus taiwanensis LMG 19424]